MRDPKGESFRTAGGDRTPAPAGSAGQGGGFLRRELRIFVSATLFALAISLIFQSWELALWITISLAFHELGHVLAAWRLGLDWEMGFGPIGAWTRTPLEKRLALSHYENSILHLLGPAFSLALGVMAFTSGMLAAELPGRAGWLRAANFNALLGAMNLLPMADLSDGGKFVRRLFASLREDVEERLLALIGVVPLLLACLTFALRLDWGRLLSLVVIVVWFAVAMLIESRLDDPLDAASPKAMTSRQGFILLLGMVAMLAVNMGIAALTPFWLTQGHVVNMVEGLAKLVGTLVWRSTGLGIALAALLVASLAGWIARRRRRARARSNQHRRDRNDS